MTEVYAVGLASSGRIAEAVEVAEHFAQSSHGQLSVMQNVAAQILGMANLAAGDLDAALQHLPVEFDTQDWAGRGFLSVNSFPRFHLLRAQALARSGDPDSAEHALDAARALRHPAYHYYGSSELLAEAWIAAARSQISRAKALALAAADFAHEHHQRAREVWCLQTAVQFDDTSVVDRLRELAGELGTDRAVVAAAYAGAVAAGDATGLETASREFELMGDRLAAADAAAQAATSHRRADHTSDAIAVAARARRLAALCGGATSPAIVGARFTAPLTEREREIVAMVACGMSNREIAQTMSLSVRTVETHIYRASNKAGVVGRAGLRAIQ